MLPARPNQTAENIGRITDMMASACRSGTYGQVGTIPCGELVRLGNAVVNAPTYDVSGDAQAVQDAYGQYRWAIDTFAGGAIWPLVEDCRTQHAGEAQTAISTTNACELIENMQEPRNALNSAVSALQSYINQ